MHADSCTCRHQVQVMRLTSEQHAIVERISDSDCNFITVSAVSGAGKTSLLTAIASKLKPKHGLYIAYNKAIATEASHKFPKSVECRTTHSLAYQNVVRQFKLKVGVFTYKSITDNIKYDYKLLIINTISNFCLSSHTSIDNYLSTLDDYNHKLTPYIKRYLTLMQSGQIECTHDFYLKLYHILLANGSIVHNTFDLLMLDEAGDLNPVTLEIFKILQATKKIMVGDENQNIYSFNNTINGFKAVKDSAVHMSMTKSFRVSKDIATRVQRFCNRHFDPDMVFEGIDYSDTAIYTQAFISRTNGTLISEMIDLENTGTKYNLIRSASQIFELPLTLLAVLSGKKFVNPEYRHLVDDYETYTSDDAIRKEYKTLFSYFLFLYSDDINLRAAINAIVRHGPEAIINAYTSAKSHEGTKHALTLCTAHSSKGLEFDSVYIADDCNLAVSKAINSFNQTGDSKYLEEFRLYYVAVTRARKHLDNATHLEY